MRLRAIAAATATAAAMAGCGSTAASRPVTVASAGRQDNIQVCRNYAKQRAWDKSLTFPTLADAIKLETAVDVDWGNTAPGTQLSKDLGAMWGDMTNRTPVYAASERVFTDCESLGVSF